MTQKAKPTKTAKAPGSKAKAPKKAAPKPAKPKSVAVYTVVRKIPAESPMHTNPNRVFASKAAAQLFADDRNRELRALTNPFDGDDPDTAMKGGEKAFLALLKKLGIATPTKQKGDSYINWERWWDHAFLDLTDKQRSDLWDAFDEYDWYKVKNTTLEN